MTDLYQRFIPGYAELAADALADAAGGPPSVPPGEVPFLTPEILREIRAQLASEPSLTLDLARRVFDRDMTLNELEQVLDELDAAFENQGLAIASADLVTIGTQLPPEFQFAGMETRKQFQHKPGDHRYEDGDKKGYGINIAAAILKRVFVNPLEAFRWHDDFASHFRYDLPDNANVALFSDFGTGLAHCWYIAKFMTEKKPTVALHLGDTYYAGRANEDIANFQAPLMDLVTANPAAAGAISHELWVLAGNHDYYSGGHAFFDGIDARRGGRIGDTTFRPHRQLGSYWCLESSAFKIIGIDVEYHSFFGLNPQYREDRLRTWLFNHIASAKSAGKSVLLMSSDEPYSICSSKLTALYHDITDNLAHDAIDLWFWGNTHYCAMFDHSPNLTKKFYGSCIGHGGFPYGAQNKLHPMSTDAAPYRWAETEPRFPRWTNVRPDMGNAGYAMMALDDTNHTVKLTYYDWTDAVRCVATFKKQGNQLVHSMIAGQPRPPCRAGE